MGEATALFDINVIGLQRVNRAVLPSMRAAGGGDTGCHETWLFLLYSSSPSSSSSPTYSKVSPLTSRMLGRKFATIPRCFTSALLARGAPMIPCPSCSGQHLVVVADPVQHPELPLRRPELVLAVGAHLHHDGRLRRHPFG